MKLQTSLKLAGAAAALVSSSLFAEIELTKEFSINGYVVGSASYDKVEHTDSDSNMDIYSYKLAGVAKFDKISVNGSLFAYGTGSGDGYNNSPVVLDAYGTYDFGNGTTVTAGKFLSWLGYEAFDIVNMATYTYANPTSAYIPAWHTGVKVENSTDAYSIGVAVLDSDRPTTAYYKGDGDLNDGVGLEAYFTYKAIKDFTLFAGLAYDSGDAAKTKFLAADLWAQYVYGKFTFAGEYCYGNYDYKHAGSADGYFVLGLLKYQVDEKWAATFRLSNGQDEAHNDFTKYTFAPTYSVTKNLDIVAEYSYIDHEGTGENFLGLQTRFKF